MATIKIKSSHPSQGDYVVIEESEFDPVQHEHFEKVAKKKVAAKKPPAKKPPANKGDK
jgi:hypothetical protein